MYSAPVSTISPSCLAFSPEDLSANADSLTDLKLGNVFADVLDRTNNFVAGNDPVGGEWTPASSDGVDLE